MIAVDGKTLRGSGHGEKDGRHLLAAFDHVHGVVLGQGVVLVGFQNGAYALTCWFACGGGRVAGSIAGL